MYYHYFLVSRCFVLLVICAQLTSGGSFRTKNCSDHVECRIGWVCTMGSCVPGKCHSSVQCPLKWSCTSALQCLPECLADDECKLGWSCSGGRVCVQGDCGECRTGEKCVEGKCFPGWMKVPYPLK